MLHRLIHQLLRSGIQIYNHSSAPQHIQQQLQNVKKGKHIGQVFYPEAAPHKIGSIILTIAGIPLIYLLTITSISLWEASTTTWSAIKQIAPYGVAIAVFGYLALGELWIFPWWYARNTDAYLLAITHEYIIQCHRRKIYVIPFSIIEHTYLRTGRSTGSRPTTTTVLSLQLKPYHWPAYTLTRLHSSLWWNGPQYDYSTLQTITSLIKRQL